MLGEIGRQAYKYLRSLDFFLFDALANLEVCLLEASKELSVVLGKFCNQVVNLCVDGNIRLVISDSNECVHYSGHYGRLGYHVCKHLLIIDRHLINCINSLNFLL